MKKLLKAAALLICFAMILSAVPFSIISAGAAEAENPSYLKGDYNGDCVIDSKDVDYIYGIVKGTTVAPAANSDEYARLNIVKDADGFTMEDVRRIARVAKGKTSAESLFSDTTEKNTYYINYFNALANKIKTKEFTDNNRFSYFVRTTTFTDTQNFKFNLGALPILGAEDTIKKMYDEEMSGTTVEYSGLRENAIIRNANMPSFDSDYVSALKASDIASIKIEKGATCNILTDGGYGNSYVRAATKTEYDVTRYNTPIADAIKVTVVLKQEDKAAVEKLPSAENGGETILMRGYGNDIRDILSEFPHPESEEVEGLLSMTMTMYCNNMTSDCTIVFYFDPITFAPIAAQYTAKIISYQHVDISVELATGGEITGKFDPTSNSIYDYYYFFNNAYPVPEIA